MEVMIVWFPLAKFAVGVVLLYLVYVLIKHEHVKSGMILAVILVMLALFNPIGYDGTNSTIAKAKSIAQKDAIVYERQASLPERKVVKSLTFSERMEVEQKRSDKANRRLDTELGI